MKKLNNEALSLLPPSIVSKFNVGLTKLKYQELQEKVGNIVYSEDNLSEIAELLKAIRNAGKTIEAIHKEGKAAALKECQDWDLAKRTFIDLLATLEAEPQKKYSIICREIDDRRRKEEAERARKNAIQEGITQNCLKFAMDISSCRTLKDLTEIERLINLEKGRKAKYQEFIDEAVSSLNELTSLISKQKERLREIEALEEQAQNSDDEEDLSDIFAKKESLESEIEEEKITVQETAINTQLNRIEEADVIYPEVKARRSVWAWEVHDIKETQKKMPSWTEIVPKEDKINEYLKAKKQEGINGEEFYFAGIKFFNKKTF